VIFKLFNDFTIMHKIYYLNNLQYNLKVGFEVRKLEREENKGKEGREKKNERGS